MKNNSLRKLLIVPAVLVGLVASGSVVSADSNQVTSTNSSSVSVQSADQHQTQNNRNSSDKSASVNDAVNDTKNTTTSNVTENSIDSTANNTSSVNHEPASNNTVVVNINQNNNTSSTNNYNQYYTQLYSTYSNRHWGYSYNAWHFYENNQEVSNKWIKWGNYWYYLDGDNMASDGVTYVSDDGTFAGEYYCFDVHGHYRTNLWHRSEGTMRDPYGPYMYFGNDGRAVDGWQKIGNYWYYFSGYNMTANVHDTYVQASNGFSEGYYSFDRNRHIIY